MRKFPPIRLSQRYFLVFAANIVFFILILSYAIYFAFARSFLQKQYSQANINNLSNVSRSVEYFLRKADEIAKYYTLFDSEAISYSYRGMPSGSRLYEFLTRLGRQKYIDGNIHSIYLYYAGFNRLVDISQAVMYAVYPADEVSRRSERKGTFYDIGWLGALRDMKYNAHGFILLRTRPLYTVEDPENPDTYEKTLLNQYPNANLITVIRAFENRMEDPRGVVVANVNEEVLSRYLTNARADSPQTSFIITTDGVVISRQDKRLLNRDLSHYDYIGRIVDAKDSEGFLTCSIDGQKSAVVYVKSAFINWIYVSVVPYAYLTRGLTSLTRIIVLIVFLILATAVASQYLLVKRAYTPIERIFDKIRRISADGKAQMDRSGIAVVEGLLDSFKMNYDHLGKLVFDNRYLLKYNFLNRLLTGECETAELERGFAEYGVRFDRKRFTVAAVAMDDMADVLGSYKLQDVYLMKQAVIDIAEKILNRRYSAVGTNIDQRHIAILINSEDRAARSELDGCFNEMMKMVEQLLQVSVSIGVGNTYDDAAMLRNSYGESLVALQNRLHKGKSAVIHHDEVNFAGSDRSYSLSHFEEQIIHCLRLGQREKCLGALRSLGADITKKNLNRSAVESIFLELIVLVHKQFNNADKSFEEICHSRFADVLDAILTFETLEGLQATMGGVFGRLCSYYAENKRNHNAEVVSKVMGYLENHYDELLSLDVVADHLKITPQYVSRLVKDVAGVNFLERLTEIRMKKSQELLLKTNLSVREISAKVGYSCYRTFLLHFRACTAMIPTQYRRTKNAVVAS